MKEQKDISVDSSVSDEAVENILENVGIWFNESGDLIDGLQYSVNFNFRDNFALSALHLCQEHCLAIYELIDSDEKRMASALALLRSAKEAMLRGYWLSMERNEENFQMILREEKFPQGRMRELLCEFYNSIDESERVILSSYFKKNQDAYNDFTHGGFLQIKRRLVLKGVIGSVEFNEEKWCCLAGIKIFDYFAKKRILQMMGLKGLCCTNQV